MSRSSYGDALTMPIMWSRSRTRQDIAKNNGVHATFIPKPIATVNGAGMHVTFPVKGR
jgi:glutamine synthetase